MTNSELNRFSWAQQVKERDGYACILCGSDKSPNAHHIKPACEGGRNSLENGQTLCRNCHAKVHAQPPRGPHGRKCIRIEYDDESEYRRVVVHLAQRGFKAAPFIRFMLSRLFARDPMMEMAAAEYDAELKAADDE